MNTNCCMFKFIVTEYNTDSNLPDKSAVTLSASPECSETPSGRHFSGKVYSGCCWKYRSSPMINLTSSLREARSERKLGFSALGFQCQSLVHLLLDDRYPQIPSSKFPQSPPLCGHYHCSSPSQKSSIEKFS